MKPKRKSPPRSRAAKPAARPRYAATPAPPLDRAVAAKMLDLWALPKEEQPQAFATWLTSAGSPKLNAELQAKVTALLDYARVAVKKPTP